LIVEERPKRCIAAPQASLNYSNFIKNDTIKNVNPFGKIK
jgi:hypothetical protein